MDDYKFVENYLSDGSKRGLIIITLDLSNLNKNSKGTFKHKMLEEKLLSNHVGFSFSKNSLMFDAVNKKIVRLVESGLAALYVNKLTYKSKIEDDEGPKVLTIGQLSAGFEIWLTCLFIALLCFITEITVLGFLKRILACAVKFVTKNLR